MLCWQAILYGAATFPYEIMGNGTYEEVASMFNRKCNDSEKNALTM